MKFTPTNFFNSIALGSGKYIQLKAYVRITSVLSDPLDSGVAWIDVTDRIGDNIGTPKLPVMWTKAEWKIGKAVFDTLQIQSNDILFWRDQIFGACNPITQYIEFKIEMRLGLSETQVASDIVYGFSGWIDQVPTWNEKEGTLTFTVFGYDEMGSRISAETINTQIIASEIGGVGVDGIYLCSLSGVYVINANVPGYQLQAGIHKITLSYTSSPGYVTTDSVALAMNATAKTITRTSGSFIVDGWTIGLKGSFDATGTNSGRQFTAIQVTDLVITCNPGELLDEASTVHTLTASTPLSAWAANLDGGIDVSLPTSNGSITLGNGTGTVGDVNEFDTQKIIIYVIVSQLQVLPESIGQDVIQKVLGDTLPSTWYNHCWVFSLLKSLYTQIGLTDYVFDDFAIESFDGRYITSYYDIPPADSFSGLAKTIYWDSINNKLWLGIGDKIFIRDMVSCTYTQVAQLLSSAQYSIERFFPDKISSDELWGLARQDGNFPIQIFKLIISTGEISSWSVPLKWSMTDPHILQTFAFAKNFSSQGAIFYLNEYGSSPSMYCFNCSDFSFTRCIQLNLAIGDYYSPSWSTGSDYWIFTTSWLQHVYISGGVWTCDQAPDYPTPIGPISEGAYLSTENKFYGSCTLTSQLLCYDLSTKTWTKFGTTGGKNFSPYGSTMYYQVDTTSTPSRASNGSVNPLVGDALDLPLGSAVTGPFKMTVDETNQRIYMISNESGLLIQYSPKATMYIEIDADFSGMYVIDAIKEIEGAFQLIGVISPNKKVNLYRRFDETGTPKTSGFNASITVDETEDIQKEENYVQACSAAIVDNGIVLSHSYNGVDFDTGFLGDGRTITISGRFIPSSLIKDFAFYVYKFFSQNLSMYTISLANVSLWQCECFDELDVTFTGTKIKKSGNGPLYGVGIDPEGSTILQVLI